MDRVVKWALMASAGALIFAACNKGAGGAKVNGPRDASRAAKNQNNKNGGSGAGSGGEQAGRKPVELKKMNDAQKKMAPVMKDLRPMMRDAGALLNEIWDLRAKSQNQKWTGGNIIKLTSEILEANFDARGIPWERKTGQAACSAPGKSEVKEVASYEYDILFAPCDKPNETPAKIVTIRKNNKADKSYSVIFHIKALTASPKLMMGNLVLMDQMLDSKKLDSGCDMEPQPNGRLGIWNCQNLAQDTGSNQYAMIETLQFEFPSKEASPFKKLTIDEFKDKDGTGKFEKQALRAIDNPVSNEFLIQLDLERSPKEAAVQAATAGNAAAAADADADAKRKADEEAARLRKEQEAQAAQNGSGEQKSADAQQPQAQPTPASANQQEAGEQSPSAGAETDAAAGAQ